MKLSKKTPCTLFEIRSVIWKGGRQVGLNARMLRQHNEVRILQKDKDGKLLYPDPFYISGEAAKSCPTAAVRGYPNVILHWVPIDLLEPLERVE